MEKIDNITSLLLTYDKFNATIKSLEDEKEIIKQKIKNYYLSQNEPELSIELNQTTEAIISVSSKTTKTVKHDDLLIELGKEKYSKFIETKEGEPYITIKITTKSSKRSKSSKKSLEENTLFKKMLNEKKQNELTL